VILELLELQVVCVACELAKVVVEDSGTATT